MQTTIGNEMPFGVPGTHANGQPFRADAYEASAAVTFGSPAYVKSGKIYTPTSTAEVSSGTYLGMAVGPEQHVRMVLPDATASITVPAGEQGIAVASRGSWFVFVASGETWAVGDKITTGIVSSKCIYKKAGDTDTKVAEVVQVSEDGTGAIIRLVA